MINQIIASKTIIIFRHIRPDMDAIGSQLALKEIIKLNFPDKNVFVTGEKAYNLASFGEMDIFPPDSYVKSLGIVLDTANKERVSDQNYLLCPKIIKFDHHPNDEPFGDIQIIDTKKSSTAEMLYYFVKENNLKMNDNIAKLLFLGIVGDTGRFSHQNTTPSSFLAASDLISYNFSPQHDIYATIYAKTVEQAKFEGYILQNLTFEDGIGYIKITKEILTQFAVRPGDIGQFLFHFSQLEGIKMWATFVDDKGFVRGSMRSAKLPINNLAAKFNGGGHPLASGFRLENMDQADLVIKEMKDYANSNQD
jgi:phosphoesterase RecJ-like protein